MNCKKAKFMSHEALEITTGKIKLVIITDCGPRIAFFGKSAGDNLLFWDDKNLGCGDWKLMGGHRVWAARPGADESEDAYRPDNDSCEVIENKDSVTVKGAKDPVLKVRKGITIKIEKENEVSVDSFILNDGDMLYSASAWALTCTKFEKGRTYGIPLGDGSEWDCFKLVMFRKWGGGHTSSFDDNQIRFTKDMLIVEPGGMETKRMLEAPYGIIAMNAPDQDTTFIKKVDYKRGVNYPLGCNVAFYVGPKNFMIEIETMSPEVTLKRGEEVHSIEEWILSDKAIGFDDIKGLLKNG